MQCAAVVRFAAARHYCAAVGVPSTSRLLLWGHVGQSSSRQDSNDQRQQNRRKWTWRSLYWSPLTLPALKSGLGLDNYELSPCVAVARQAQELRRVGDLDGAVRVLNAALAAKPPPTAADHKKYVFCLLFELAETLKLRTDKESMELALVYYTEVHHLLLTEFHKDLLDMNVLAVELSIAQLLGRLGRADDAERGYRSVLARTRRTVDRWSQYWNSAWAQWRGRPEYCSWEAHKTSQYT